MGPLATADFMARICTETPAKRDQDHIPVVLFSVPRTPDRTQAIFGLGEDPLPSMAVGISALDRLGAHFISIPCNTAHHWYDALSEVTNVPIVHIADAVIRQLHERGITSGPVGLLATAGTIKSGFYQRWLAQFGFECRLGSDFVQDAVMGAIRKIKSGDIDSARTELSPIVLDMVDGGAQTIILGCTELPLAMNDAPAGSFCVDSTVALARLCVSRYRNVPTTTQR